MPKTATLIAPDGKKIRLEVPDDATESQILEFANQAYKPQSETSISEPKQQPIATPAERTWSQVPFDAAKNFIPDAANVVQGAAHAVMHPIETAGNIKDLAVGAASNMLPERFQSPDSADERQLASNVGQFYKDRYGSAEGFKNALADHPAEILADAATLATGGGAVASKLPVIGKAGEVAIQAGKAVDPVNLAIKAGSKVAGYAGNKIPEILGATTGTGAEAVRSAYEAGKEGGSKAKAFAAHLRGNADIGEIVPEAKAALLNMRKARGDQYRAGMADIKADDTVLNFDPIQQAADSAMNVSNYKGKSINRSAAGVQEKIADVINEWKGSDPYDFHTAEGFDALKQTIGDIRDNTEYGSPSRVVADRVYNAVKDQIVNQAPDYAKVMKDYEDASKLTSEIERGLSLGNKASTDTAVRKLQSLTRNNVSTNYGNRMTLARELEQNGAPDLVAKVSGQAMNKWTPRGLQTAAAIPEIGMAYMIDGAPLAIPAAIAASPRLVGEGAFAAGKTAKALRAGANLAGKANDKFGIDPTVLANYLYQADRLQGE